MSPGIGRADVWVFDATSLGSSLGGTPLTIVTLFGDRPRALTATPDGSRVYAAVYRSGNQNDRQSVSRWSATSTAPEPCNVQGTIYPRGGSPSLCDQPSTGDPTVSSRAPAMTGHRGSNAAPGSGRRARQQLEQRGSVLDPGPRCLRDRRQRHGAERARLGRPASGRSCST